MKRRQRSGTISALVWILGFATGCGGGSGLEVGAPQPATTPTRTATKSPTPLPTATATAASGALNGLIVVNDAAAANSSEDLGTPPAAWGNDADKQSFGRALGHADYQIGDQQGSTAADGSFSVRGLPPGRYLLQVSRTVNGNLIPVSIPIVVGDDGAQVIAEVGMGVLRTSIAYRDGDVIVREIIGSSGTKLVTRDGHIAALGDASRTLTDTNGDGQFERNECSSQISACSSDAKGCADGQRCQCISACPFCDNCEMPGVCGAPSGRTPYRCNSDDSCSLPGDQCVSTCPDCAGGGVKVCVPTCEPLSITAIDVHGPAQIVAGHSTQLYASAELSDGTVIDVTQLVDWQSSHPDVATVDSWGQLTATQIGATTISATLDTVHGGTLPLNVVDHPALRSIRIQNQSCYCGPIYALDDVAAGALPPCYYAPVPSAGVFRNPSCSSVIAVGTTLKLLAIGDYADDSQEDLTDQVEWTVAPSAVGNVDAGSFTATSAGSAKISAALGAVTSDAVDITVVTAPTLVSISIYPGNWGYLPVAGGPLAGDAASPCFNCGSSVTVLRNDTLQFQATGHYDTDEWRDITKDVTWRSSDTGVAPIQNDGSMTAASAGAATIDAYVGSITSNPVAVQVVDHATLQSLSIYQDGGDRVVAKADQRYFHASGFYDIGISRDVTNEAVWHSSDDTIGGFDSPGIFTGRNAGSVEVWAEQDGQRSNSLTLEVFETTELAYCDATKINRAVWSDDFNRVVLESDCASYTEPGLVTLRYTVSETQPHGGIFDPCLDLYVYQGDRRVRTIREEGCGEPFLPTNAPGADDAALKYQLRAFWDLKDDAGNPVPNGAYTIYGRFYLYYDPVVKLAIQVGGGTPVTPQPTPPLMPTATPAGNRSAVLALGSTSATAGQPVAVEAGFRANGAPVAGLQNDLTIAAPLRFAASDAGKPLCKVNDTIGKPATTFAFLPTGCSPGVDCTGVRALVIALDNVAPLPDGAMVYSCVVEVPTDAMPASYAVGCSNASASDPRGASLPLRCVDGSVSLQGANAPPPISDPSVDGTCYLGSTACSGNSFYPTAQERCCALWRSSMSAAGLSWCPAVNLDAAGRCTKCAANPCDGM